MPELAPPPEPGVRRGQTLDSLVWVEHQIAMLQTEKRLMIARLHREDRAGMLARYVREEPATMTTPEDVVQDEQDEQVSLDDLDWYALHRPLLPDEVRRDPRGGRPAYLSAWWSDTAFRTALHRLATDPFRPVDLSTDTYVVPKALKRHVELRDRTCIFPGCPRRAMDSDKDHLIPWPRGSTSALNLGSECRPHHIAKHEYFTVDRLPDGTFRWTSPAGITADRPPLPVLDAWTYRTGR